MSCGRRDRTITAPQASVAAERSGGNRLGAEVCRPGDFKGGSGSKSAGRNRLPTGVSQETGGWETDTVLTFLEKQSWTDSEPHREG